MVESGGVRDLRVTARREQILGAATRVFAEKGFRRATTREVARQAGVSEGTIYNYFEDKDALLMAIMDTLNETERRAEDFQEGLATDFEGFVEAYLRHRMALIWENREIFRVVMSEMLVDAQLRERYMREVVGPTMRIGEENFRERVEQGTVRDADAPLAMRAVAGVLKDGGFAKDPHNAQDPEQRAEGPWVPGFLKPLEQNMLDLDDPDHRRLRTRVSKAFTPRLIEKLRGRIEAICRELLDAMERKGRAELVRDYALPLPATVIAELLGVPAEDHRKFHRWSNRIVSVSSGRDVWRALPAALAFVRYLRKMSQRRRISPQDDLMSALVQAEEAGDKLSQDELLAMSFLLLVAGHETTVNLIASGTLALTEHPEQLERLEADPPLIKPALEELLRYTSPVEIATERYARQDLEVSGTEVPRGGLVLAVLGSANRDDRHFDEPDALDLARDPNKHLAFGRGGVHHCLGAPLARMEGQIAITALLQRFPDLHLAVSAGSLRWRRGLFLRGPERLPLELTH